MYSLVVSLKFLFFIFFPYASFSHLWRSKASSSLAMVHGRKPCARCTVTKVTRGIEILGIRIIVALTPPSFSLRCLEVPQNPHSPPERAARYKGPKVGKGDQHPTLTTVQHHSTKKDPCNGTLPTYGRNIPDTHQSKEWLVPSTTTFSTLLLEELTPPSRTQSLAYYHSQQQKQPSPTRRILAELATQTTLLPDLATTN